MPTNIKRKSRHSKGSIYHLDKYQRYGLLEYCFCDIFGDRPDGSSAFKDMAEAKAAWKANRKELMAEYIAKWPGMRPWGWRVFDHPEVKEEKVGESGYFNQDKVYRIYDEFERSFEALARTGHLKDDEVIPKFDLEEIEMRSKRISDHNKLMAENPPEKIEQAGRNYSRPIKRSK